ncbi:MAG: hypothetical protein HN348_06140 [Proteobacteria bacterium]|jgi:hypothetical protein|nr:hypothetical protein [Pseudomonadota bacterium]
MQFLLLSHRSPLATETTALPVKLILIDGSEKQFDLTTQPTDRALVGTGVPLFFLHELLRRCQSGLLAEVLLIVDAPDPRAARIGFRHQPWLGGIYTLREGAPANFDIPPAPVIEVGGLDEIVHLPIATNVFAEAPSAFPAQIQIQTTNACRANCPYCPKGRLNSPLELMSLSVFRQIVAACKKGQPRSIELYFHGEPLLDGRMAQLSAEAKSACPQAMVSVVTHESMANELVAMGLFDSGLDVAFVSVNVLGRPHEPVLRERLERIAAIRTVFRTHGKELVVVTLHNFLQRGIRGLFRRLCRELDLPIEAFAATSRAGSIDVAPFVRPSDKAPKGPCSLPFVKTFVRFDGAVVLCCEDWEYRRVLGHLAEAPLEEIWTGEAYRCLRRELLQKRLTGPCLLCDLE